MNLTEKQQQIIDQITKDFGELNSRPENTGSLIDVLKIKQKRLKDEEKKIEVAHRNKAFAEKFHEEVNAIVCLLKRDFSQLGFMVRLVEDNTSWADTSIDRPDCCIHIFTGENLGKPELRIRVKTITDQQKLNSGDHISQLVGFYYSFKYHGDIVEETDIKKIINHHKFEDTVQRMYDRQQKNQ